MRRAFTLVELLSTIGIITILAAMSLGALHAVQQSAKIDRTKATIAKINAYVMDQYESHRTRRIPANLQSSSFATVPANYWMAELAGRRLDAIRDLMRMEMPDRWNDIGDPPLSFTWTNGNPWMPSKPALTQRFQAKYDAALAALQAKGYAAAKIDDIMGRYASAKLLYMIVMAHDPEAAEHFRSDEIARPTEDGFPVFVDAWGNPIKFLRWAPGFDQSDVQAVVSPIDNATARANASAANPDPFNPKRVYRVTGMTAPYTNETGTPTGGTTAIPIGWALYPLIYSAGPDGIYDISVGSGGTDTYHYTGDPYQVFTPASTPICSMGSATDYDNISLTAEGPANGSHDHFDNITNHQGGVK